jgi:hypothetical protein
VPPHRPPPWVPAPALRSKARAAASGSCAVALLSGSALARADRGGLQSHQPRRHVRLSLRVRAQHAARPNYECVRALRGPRWGRMVASQLPALVNGGMSQQGTVQERCTRCVRSPGGMLAACPARCEKPAAGYLRKPYRCTKHFIFSQTFFNSLYIEYINSLYDNYGIQL